MRLHQGGTKTTPADPPPPRCGIAVSSIVKRFTLAFLFTSLIGAGPAHAAELELELAARSSHAWRGIVQDAHAVLQPSATLAGTTHGLSLNLWASVDLEGSHEAGLRTREFDVTLAWQRSWSIYEATFGLRRYSYPHSDWKSTLELSASLALDTRLHPKISIYQDIDVIDGTYVDVSVGHFVPLSLGRLSGVELFAAIGFADRNCKLGYLWEDALAPERAAARLPDDSGLPGSGPHNFVAGLALPFELGSTELRVRLEYVSLVDDWSRAQVGGRTGEWVFGVAIKRSF